MYISGLAKLAESISDIYDASIEQLNIVLSDNKYVANLILKDDDGFTIKYKLTSNGDAINLSKQEVQ